MERPQPTSSAARAALFAAPVVISSVLALLVPDATRAQSEQVPVGPRAIAMGGAFSAIADDGSALFWNPAGLARVGHQEITATHADLFKTGIRENFVSFVLPLAVRHALAADWYHSGFDDDELGFGENRLDMGWGMRAMPWLFVGTSLKYFNRSTSLDGSTVSKGHGTGADLGFLASPWRGLRLALVAQDLLDTRIRRSDGASEVVYPRNLRAAASYGIEHIGTVALDLDDRWHFGIEAYPHALVAVRGGVQDDIEAGDRPSWSYGLGVKAGVFRFDWARQQHPTLDATDHFALAMEFNFNPAQIRIEKVEAREIYTSQIKRYAREPFGTLQVRNLLDQPLEARVSVFVPELMDAPSSQSVLLRPKAVQEVPITAVFTDRALARGEDRPVQVEVRASYVSRRLMREDKAAARCVAYAPGAIHWGDGVDQAAAFVTTRDPVVDAVAREASRVVARMEGDPFGNRNLGFAAAMTDALASLGIAYVPDPNNPYSAISETAHAVDTVHYPHETLASRTGDCDDTTVLMAALLGNVGVPTMLVDAPGHLSLLVGTGVHERNRVTLGLDDRYTVIAGEEVWIPLETTEVSKGFAQAWRVGAETYAGWEARGRVQLVDVAEAQTRFEPVVPPARRDPPMLDERALLERLRQDAATVTQWRNDFMGARFGEVRDLGRSEPAEIQVVEVLVSAGSLDEAQQRLEALRAADSTSARVLNDLAVIAATRGYLGAAESHLRRALAHDTSDPGIWLNWGLVRWAQGDTVGAAEPLRRAISLAGGVDAAAAQLGRDGAATAEARLLLEGILQRVARAPGTSQPTEGQAAGQPRADHARTARMRTSTDPAEIAGRIGPLLYWRR